jgi:hypothetical protein
MPMDLLAGKIILAGRISRKQRAERVKNKALPPYFVFVHFFGQHFYHHLFKQNAVYAASYKH